jgi:hypothetical protein
MTEMADEFEPYLERQMRDPVFRAAYERARRELDESTQVICPYGHCVNDVYRGRIIGGFGSPYCPCDNLPGWNAKYPDGLPKPRTPVLPKGRHGNRVRRSIRRHQLPDYLMDAP